MLNRNEMNFPYNLSTLSRQYGMQLDEGTTSRPRTIEDHGVEELLFAPFLYVKHKWKHIIYQLPTLTERIIKLSLTQMFNWIN